jgi:hypothetical protein
MLKCSLNDEIMKQVTSGIDTQQDTLSGQLLNGNINELEKKDKISINSWNKTLKFKFMINLLIMFVCLFVEFHPLCLQGSTFSIQWGLLYIHSITWKRI